MSGKAKKELMSSAPWRVQEEAGDEFADAKLKVTRQQAGGDSTMHVPRKKTKQQHVDDDDSLTEIDPELRYSFHRNYQFLRRVFSIDTIVKPLPASMAYNVSRNLNFFTRIFTQFFGKFICLLFVGAKMMDNRQLSMASDKLITVREANQVLNRLRNYKS